MWLIIHLARKILLADVCLILFLFVQTYNTGDTSRNNWWVGIVAFGEGWHNNHHAFEYSARHGFEWWQIDMTWYVIRALQAVGLASNVKLVSEKQKARLAY